MLDKLSNITLNAAKRYTDSHGGGGGGTSNYNDLSHKPVLNGVTLQGNMTLENLGIQGSETGKGLSTNDYSDVDKAIVDGVTTALGNKVDKVSGKGLSENDYTDADKAIVGGVTSALAGKADASTVNGILDGSTIDSFADVETALGNKADKVSSATNGNFAGLDSNGNLTDSGKSSSDFLPSNTPIPDAVTANPQGTATGTLTKLGIGSSIYEIQGGGDTSIISDDFDSSKTYAIDDYCIYNSILYRCIAPHTGSWDATHFENTTVGEELTNVNDLLKTAVLVPWSAATDAQIVNMINAYYDGHITLDDVKSVWSIGDCRDMDISAIAASGGSGSSVWNVGESHRAQTLQARIIDFNHDTLHTPINGITKALITVDLKNFLRDATVTDNNGQNNTENGYQNPTDTNEGGWNGCARRAWCNNGFYGALPSYIRNIVKEVDKPSSSGGSSPTLITSVDKVFVPSMIEIFGVEYGNYQQALTGEGSWYELYKTASNLARVPRYSSSYISFGTFLRTASVGATNGFVTCDASCNIGANDASTIRALAPLWCM